MSSPFQEPKPWPMKWIAVVILICLAAYTVITLQYRKPNRPYRPSEDLTKRVNTSRLLSAGFRRLELMPQRVVEPPLASNHAFPAPGGLPQEIKRTIVTNPLLATDIIAVQAAGALKHGSDYAIRFRCAAANDKQQLGAVDVYIKGDEIVVAPTFDRLGAELQARTAEAAATVVLPADALKPGSYRVSMIGERSSRAWTLHIE